MSTKRHDFCVRLLTAKAHWNILLCLDMRIRVLEGAEERIQYKNMVRYVPGYVKFVHRTDSLGLRTMTI